MVSAPITIAQLFERQAEKYGDRPFLYAKRAKTWRAFTWRELDRQIRGLRGGLAGLGLGPGDRIAILSDNCPEWVAVDQAVMGLGGVVVPLYTTSSTEETTHVLADSATRALAVRGPEHLRKVISLADSLPELKTVIVMHEGHAERSAGARTIISMEELSSAAALAVDPTIDPDSLATIIYTSGTTGIAKGVMLTHRNLLSNSESSRLALNLDDHDMTLSFLPVAHAFERTAGHYTVMLAGASIAYAEGLGQIAQNLLEMNPTVVLTVPRLLEAVHERIMRTVGNGPAVRRKIFELAMAAGRRATGYRLEGRSLPIHLVAQMAIFRRLALARIRGIFGNRLRYLISGGAPLPAEIFDFFAAAELPIVEGYGLTEAGPVVSVNLHGQTRRGTVGRPLPNVEVRTAPDGELLVRGANVMKGYYRLEQDTREAIDAEGWLHTGDIATIDDGYIAIRDRKKEIIVLSGGKNVSPAYLESKLVHEPLIAQACVVGDRRKHLAALLVPNFDSLRDRARTEGLSADSAQQLVADPVVRGWFQQRLRELNRTVSDIEAISAWRLLSEPFSQENGLLTPTLKIRRRAIAQRYHAEIEAMYE